MDIEELDNRYAKTERVVVMMTPLLKTSLELLARKRRITVSQIIRLAIFKCAEIEYPELIDIYTKSLSRENK